MDSFIREFKTPINLCDDIIKYFKDNKKRHVPGRVLDGNKNDSEIDKRAKVSTDMFIPLISNEKIFKKYNKFLIKCVEKYIRYYPDINFLDKFGLIEGYNIQYYKKNEGFKLWHSERGSQTSKRMLVFMTYLNDVPDGGTLFKYQKITTKAKKGVTLLWPSDFTHTHKSQISKKYSKYIVTGWLNFI